VTFLLAFLRRDSRVELSYRAAVGLELLSGISLVLLLFFLGRTVGRVEAVARWGGDWFEFAFVGVILGGPLSSIPAQLASRVRESQLTGAIGPLMISPLGPVRTLIGLFAWPFLSQCVKASIYLVCGVLLLGVRLRAGGVPGALGVFALASAAQLGVGLWSASFILVFKRGDPVATALDHLTALFGGTWFPVTVLPLPLQALAAFLPVMHALAAMRVLLLTDGGSVLAPVAALVVLAGILLPTSILAVRAAVMRARRDGSLLHV
jgi:ABC-2 type transport system permease protein